MYNNNNDIDHRLHINIVYNWVVSRSSGLKVDCPKSILLSSSLYLISAYLNGRPSFLSGAAEMLENAIPVFREFSKIKN